LTTGADPIAERLSAGENVIWRGQPKRGLLLRENDALLITFSLPFMGLSTFVVVMVIKWGVPLFAIVFFAIFWLYGLFLFFGRLVFDAWIRARAFYALTDRRILILRSRPWTRFQSIALDQSPEPTLHETASGRGTITFGRVVPYWNRFDRGGVGFSIASLEEVPQFLAIENARKVFAMVQEKMRAGQAV
jgi:hypothetical protein